MTTASPAARSLAESLNRSARRIFQAERQGPWTAAALDAAAEFCERAALFTVQGAALRFERATFAASAFDAPLAEAPAAAEALAALEPVAAAWSPRELSEAMTSGLAAPRSGRAHLFPISSNGKAVALLLADGAAGELDSNGLELICSIAGAAWELRAKRNGGGPAASMGLIALTAAAKPAEAELELHQRAKRFASVRVAELRLYGSDKVRQGREDGNLYDLFREEIDRERVRFRAAFLEKAPSMADYLHEELVRTLAQGRAGRMGENYPGALVRS